MDNRLNGLNPLAYQGVAPLSVPQLVFFNIDPSTSDSKNFALGCIWLNRSNFNVWVLVNLAAGVATWIKFAGTPGNASSFPTDSGTAFPTALGALTVHGGSNMNTSGAGSTVTVNLNNSISVSGTITAGSDITTTGGNLVANTGAVHVFNSNNDGTAALIQMLKSRSGGVVNNGDQVGRLDYLANDGTQYLTSGSIVVAIDSTVAANQVPGAITFNTHPRSASGPLARMIINSLGNVTINTPDSGAALTVSGTITGTTLYASADAGGAGSTNALSNVSNTSANGGGTFTIASKSANNATSSGFLKVYVGTVPFWIPFFANPAP